MKKAAEKRGDKRNRAPRLGLGFLRGRVSTNRPLLTELEKAWGASPRLIPTPNAEVIEFLRQLVAEIPQGQHRLILNKQPARDGVEKNGAFTKSKRLAMLGGSVRSSGSLVKIDTVDGAGEFEGYGEG